MLLISVIGTSAATCAHARDTRMGSAQPSIGIAIADFDGDLRPDIASVAAGQSSISDYDVRVRLTATEFQSVRIVAPFGGLQITARDVNGDRALDLVLTANGLRRTVAILINDGLGKFTKADPSGFSEQIGAAAQNWSGDGRDWSRNIAVPLRLCPGINSGRRRRISCGLQNRRILQAPTLLSRYSQTSHEGRAPPRISSL